MGLAIGRNPIWMVKLSATSVGFQAAIAKLIAYQKDVAMEKKKDQEFYNNMVQAYIDTADIDKDFSEKFADLSSESDDISWEMVNKDEFEN
ncbi:hypothetical protein [Radiobacillus sp. PE A8.2]|uniref:hypothetical protein n=1 Tax=Radiobacillus sp. PE A8.2 TaxID=3380349 RepID=UPI00388EC146